MSLLAAMAGGANILGTMMTNRSNEKMAREQNEFQARMSNTSVQRHVRDLESAGFNRLLAMGTSGGASTPVGARANFENPAKDLSALDMIAMDKSRADISRTKAEETLIANQAAKAASEARIAKHDADLITSKPLPSKSQTGIYGIAAQAGNPVYRAGEYIGEKLADFVNYFKE